MKKSLSLLVSIFVITSILYVPSIFQSPKNYTNYYLSNRTIIVVPPIIVPNKNLKKKSNLSKKYLMASTPTPIVVPIPHAPKQSKKIAVPTKRRAFETEYVQA